MRFVCKNVINMNNCKVLKRVFSAVTVLTATLAQMTSCDSREDWFAKEGEEVAFVIKTSKSAWWTDEEKYEFRNDTVYSNSNRVVEYNLKLNKVTPHKDSHGNITSITYHSENLNIDIEGYGMKVSKNDFAGYSVTTNFDSPEFVGNGSDNKCYFLSYEGDFPPTTIDVVKPILNTADVIIELDDVFRNKKYCHIRINCLGNLAPEPYIEIKDVEGKSMEKVLNLGNLSFDEDGSISMYEYCIDGEIRHYNLPVYDCDPNGVSAGKGAYGGTYITSTDNSEIKHAFQTKGEHIVYFRCMDNLGLWSLWRNVTVTIE